MRARVVCGVSVCACVRIYVRVTCCEEACGVCVCEVGEACGVCLVVWSRGREGRS